MNDAEHKVISLIENSNNLSAALEVAIKLALEFLEHLQDVQCMSPEPLLEVS